MRKEKPCGTYSERRDVILWRLISMREIHLTFRDARFVRPLIYTSLRLGARGKSPLMRTHEPCVPTGQANFPHGLLTTPKAPLLKSLAIGLWTLSLSGKYLQCLFHSAWRYSLLTDIAPHGISFLCFRPNNFKIIFIYAIDLLLLIYSGSNGWLFFTMAVIICMSLFLTLFNATCFFFPLFTSLL